ncbi:MAG: hypothetical protein R3280_00785 [Marinobacter sp.]|uniref:hypothetical protein n=1 Tax=Marinobacter sp. TaxID=50741 RepID=UPI00299DD493|nr:hypothetical protein [Marinobacter sp.]MDX1633147.1 hypothetical protein [Marinobacter sp.]
MIRRNRLFVALAGTLTLPAYAGVQSLTSEEMVDTYVRDSAIIIVPREQQKPAEERQRIIRSLTISPGEPVVKESEEQAFLDALRDSEEEGREQALEEAREEFVRRAILLPQEEVARAQPTASFIPTVSPIIFGQQAEIPDEPFTQTFLNDQLSIGFDGQNVNFSIGNPPGIDQIQVPRGINEGPIQLTPRAGGGFDLSIAVPER